MEPYSIALRQPVDWGALTLSISLAESLVAAKSLLSIEDPSDIVKDR